MVGNDIKNVTNDNWTVAICTKPSQIVYLRDCPVEAIGYGVVFHQKRINNTPAQIQTPFGFDYYDVYLIGYSEADITAFLKQLCDIFDSATIFVSNTTYSRFFINVDNVQTYTEWKGEELVENVRHIALAGAWCVKRIHDAQRLGDPRFNELGESR